MTKFRAAIVGGGIAGLCLAAALSKGGNIQVDVYEASEKFGDIGAGITLWGRVCAVLRLMDLADDCIQASLIAAASSRSPISATMFILRSNHKPNEKVSSINFQGRHINITSMLSRLTHAADAWRLSRADFLDILLRRVSKSDTHLGKRLQRYSHNATNQTTTLTFSDGTTSICDLVIGCDGILSSTRSHMVRQLGTEGAMRAVEPRWSGAVAYRISMPMSSLAAKNPRHSMLAGGQIYCGKNKHIVGYPSSPSTLSISINITAPSMEDTRWQSPAWARRLSKEEFFERVAPLFVDWDAEVLQLIETIDSAIQWAIHDLDPLPCYVRGRVALIGDAAHASMPYTGIGVTDAIEDAYVLSRVLCSGATTRDTLPLALEAYQAIRMPHGNRHILSARKALRTLQYNGPEGKEISRMTETIRRLFEETAGIGESGPMEEAQRAISWLKERLRRTH